MFFTIGQKIINLMLKTNIIFNYKVGIVGFLLYLIFGIGIKSPLFSQINWNNWMLFIMCTVFLLIDGLLLSLDYINTIKKLEIANAKIQENLKPITEQTDYETTTELETTIE